MNKIKREALRGVVWKTIEAGGATAVQFVVGIFLARLVVPEQFGAIAILMVFIGVLGTFVNSGFSEALVRKTRRTQADCSTVFWFNILMSVGVYILLFAVAPWVASFYGMPQLCLLLRVTSLSVLLSAPGAVPNTLLRADLNFRSLSLCNLSGVVVSGIVGVWMAYRGMQAWALVAQIVLSSAVSTLCVWFVPSWRSSWHPTWRFSRSSFREFVGFGWKLQASGLLDALYTNMFGAVIGKVFRAAELAYYNRANTLSRLTSTLPNNVLQSVTYPVMCRLQDTKVPLRDGYRLMLRVSAFVVFPLCLGLGALAYPVINVIYSSRWIAAAPMLQVLCFAMMWFPIHSINLNLLQVKGRTDLFFRLEIVKKVIGVTVFCITIPLGIMPVCYGLVFTSLFALVINTWYTGKLLGLGLIEQMRDIAPSLVLSLAMYGLCRVLTSLLGTGVLSLITGVISGVIFYFGIAILLRLREVSLLRHLFD